MDESDPSTRRGPLVPPSGYGPGDPPTGPATAAPATAPPEGARPSSRLPEPLPRTASVSPFEVRPGAAEPPPSPAPAAFSSAGAAAATTSDAFDGRSARERLRRAFRLSLRVMLYAFGGWLALVLLAILAFRFVDPPTSALMLIHRLSGDKVVRNWVPLRYISPHLVRAVIASEDGRFCRHFGVDIREIGAAIERARDGVPRGASTISMQVAKNMFLWPAKSYVRKAIELPLTVAIELVWPKWRIAEVYLNSAEWGPGIFGAEAAARYHFAKPASRLTEREAALLAVALPNPITRDAGDPGPGTARLATIIQARVRKSPQMAACVVERVEKRQPAADADR